MNKIILTEYIPSDLIAKKSTHIYLEYDVALCRGDEFRQRNPNSRMSNILRRRKKMERNAVDGKMLQMQDNPFRK